MLCEVCYRLGVTEVYVDVKYASLWYMMNEVMNVLTSKFYENGDYVNCVLMHAHTLLTKWMKLITLKGGVLGWTLFMSWYEVFCSNLTISQDLPNVGWRMDNLHELRCGVQ